MYEHIERDPVRILFIRRVLDCNHYIPTKYKKQVKLYHGIYAYVLFHESCPEHIRRSNSLVPISFKLLQMHNRQFYA